MPDLLSLFGTDCPVALVTGSGAPRVGNVVARTLAARGYRLVIHANTSIDAAQATADQLAQQGCQAIALRAQLGEESEVRALVQQAHSRFGRIDALVNCAAIWKPLSLEQVTAEDVRRNFEINTLGTFLCCQHVGLLMVGQNTGGAIVNVGDWAVVRPYLNYTAYFASKGAIPTLTRDFAVELAHRNPRVRVNAVLPGPVMFPPDLPEVERQQATGATLARREGKPENVAHAIVFLLENDFVTGACLPVDGGRSISAP